MSDEPSPRPWRAEQNVVGWTSFIVDANGNGVAACWRTARGDDEKERQYNEANAALIVDAVNFYDRTVDKQLVALLDERDQLRDQLAAALRLVRVCMRAQGVHREAIEAAVNAAKKEQAQ